MTRRLGILPLLGLLGIEACRGGSSDTNVRTCQREALEGREQRTVVVDLTDGGPTPDAGEEPDACVVDCPGVIPEDPFTDAASCGPPCLEAVRSYGYDDPRLVGCHESAVSIGCTFDVRVVYRCDPQ